MANITRADVLEYLEKANMLEISELIKEIEQKFDVKAAAPVAVAAVAAAPNAGAAEPHRLRKKPSSTWSSKKLVPIRST